MTDSKITSLITPEFSLVSSEFITVAYMWHYLDNFFCFDSYNIREYYNVRQVLPERYKVREVLPERYNVREVVAMGYRML